MKIKKLLNIVLFLISTLFALKCFALKKNYMYVGEGLHYSTIEDALQECTDNFIGLQNVETSIFIKSGIYKPQNTLKCTVFGETSTINFIGEGIDKTILECHSLNRLIALQIGEEYKHHSWSFKDMTIKGCQRKIESINVNSGTINFENIKFTGNENAGAVILERTANGNFNNTIFIDNYEGPNIELSTNGIINIKNSKLLGFPSCFNENKKCKRNLINILSKDRVILNIENSELANTFFNAEDPSLSENEVISNLGASNFNSIIIKNSLFHNSMITNSGAISVTCWKTNIIPEIYIYNTTFKNNVAYQAAAIRTAGYLKLKIEDCYFYNNTSKSVGIIYHNIDLTEEGTVYKTEIELNNCYIENSWENNYEEYSIGKIYASSGFGASYFRNLIVNNFKRGNLVYSPYSTTNFINCTFSNLNLKEPVFKLDYQDEEFIFDGCTFKNINIDNEEYGLIYTSKNSGKLNILNSNFSDFISNNAAILLSEINDGSDIYFINNTLTNIYSMNGIIVIKNDDIGNNKYNGINIKNDSFINCSSVKTAIISIDYGSFANISGCTFINSGTGKEFAYVNISGSVLQISGNSEVNFENNVIEDCYSSDSGSAINLSLNSNLNIYNSTFSNCLSGLDSGIMYFNYWEGNLTIKNSEFINNAAILNGGIFLISNDNVLENANILIEDSNFKNNKASLGAIIYIGIITSKFDITKNLKIRNSNFVDNEADAGEILFISEASQAKYIFDKNEINEDKIDTHPSYLSWDSESIVIYNSDRKILKSGDNIPNGLKAYILSNNNRLYDIITQNTGSLLSVIFVNATILDQYGKETNDAIIVGDRETFCWDGICNLNTVKVYGKEGQYTLQIYVISNGGFISMNSKNITINITIEKCDREFNNDYLKIGYDICYNPACSKCVHGNCGDMNICTCTDPSIWKGDACDERYKYIFSLTLRVIFEIICFISALFSILLIYGIWSNQKETVIKKSNPTFLIVAVIGSIINYSTVIFYHGDRNSTSCTTVLWVKYIGFAVLYGSIMIRIMKVWRIIVSSKNNYKTTTMTKSTMFTYLFLIISVYIIILIICTIIQKIDIEIKISFEKEFYKCKNTTFMFLLYGSTIAVLLWGVYLALETSNLPEQFNEAKSVGISTYVYAFAMIISEIIDNITALNPDYSFLLNITCMLIYTWTSIFTIVVPKVYAVYSEWFIIIDVLKRNILGTDNIISFEQSGTSNRDYMDNMGNVGGLSVIDRK